MPIAALAAGGSQQYAAPVPLNLGSYGLVQARFTLEPVALAGPALDDIDLGISFGQISDLSLPQITGKYNMVDQLQSSADTIGGQAHAAHKTMSPGLLHATPSAVCETPRHATR